VRKIRMVLFLLFSLLLFSSCSGISPQSSPSIPSQSSTPPQIIPSSTPQATETVQVLPSPTLLPTQTATAVTSVPVQGTIAVENFRLRNGPGFLFATISLYKQNSIVEVYGKSQGGGWLYVTTSNNLTGWMKSEYITMAVKIETLPVVEFKEATVIFGHVRNSKGVPMSGIGIVIFPAVSGTGSTQDVALTDSSGAYYLYLPKNLSGDYTVGVNAYNCESNAVDSQCQLLYKYPSAQSINIPQTAPISAEFVLPDL
jgi:hypothetical protein